MSLKCPRCGSRTGVANTVPVSDGVVRRRVCKSCRNSFSTREVIEPPFTPRNPPHPSHTEQEEPAHHDQSVHSI